MKKHYNITISGRVQGVGFRFSCSEMAHLVNVNGYVTNEKDGAVFIEAEGDETDLLEFISWCRKGPAWAKVTDVKLEEDEMVNYESFKIKR